MPKLPAFFWAAALALSLGSPLWAARWYGPGTLVGSQIACHDIEDWLYGGGTKELNSLPFSTHPGQEGCTRVRDVFPEKDAVILSFMAIRGETPPAQASRLGSGVTLSFEGRHEPSRNFTDLTLEATGCLPNGLWLALELDSDSRKALRKNIRRVPPLQEIPNLQVQDRLRAAGLTLLSGETVLPAVLLGKILFGELRRNGRRIPFRSALVGSSSLTPAHFFRRSYELSMRSSDDVSSLVAVSDAMTVRGRTLTGPRVMGAYVANTCSMLLFTLAMDITGWGYPKPDERHR